MIYRWKDNAEHEDHQQYSVFMSHPGGSFLTEYGYRWETESGYRSIKRFTAATTSKDFGLRFFYFAFACLLYSIWRAIDLLVQVELTGEYEHSPIVTADNILILLKKETKTGRQPLRLAECLFSQWQHWVQSREIAEIVDR